MVTSIMEAGLTHEPANPLQRSSLHAGLTIFFMAMAYWGFGRLAIIFASPPGYATIIWPSAGLALAGVLFYGHRIWPGIVLGSFMVNVWTALNTSEPLPSVLVATAIGLGAALQ